MPALLEVAGLRKQYGAIVVADDVTFSLEPGDCLGMIGPNGAGKSSVFNLIAGTVAEDGGTIRFEGRDLKGLPAHLRARLGIVRAFQIPQPFPHLTVYENVLAAAAFGAGLPGSEAAARSLGVLEDIGLAGKAHVLAGQLPCWIESASSSARPWGRGQSSCSSTRSPPASRSARWRSW